MVTIDWLVDLRRTPDIGLALARYESMAGGYDHSCWRIARLRARAIDELDPQPGEVVADVACGTGVTTLTLARRVGASGLVIGIEQSPAMASIAGERLTRGGVRNVRIEVVSVDAVPTDTRVDAMLFSYTHDVLQCPESIAALQRLAKPGARYVLVGMRTLPWVSGWPVNLFVMWRARRYLTTFRGLGTPWRLLRAVSCEFRLIGTWHAGTSYVAVGRFC